MDPDPDFARAIFQNIGKHWLKEEHCDLKIIIGDFMVLCNEFLLCSCSEFFNVLLHSDPSCTNKAGHITVKVSGIAPDIFMLVLNSIFKGENRIDETNMIDLLYAAHHLQIDFLVHMCEAFIADHVTVENYLNVYPHFAILKSELILDKILEIMARDFDRFRQTQVFLNLTIQTMLSIIERKDIPLYDSVVEALLQWVEHEETQENYNTSDFNVAMTDTSCNASEALASYDSDSGFPVKEAGFIEVIFCNEKFVSGTETKILNRKNMLGEMVKNVHLHMVSKQGLKLLLDNDLVMDNREARNAVRKYVSLQMDREKQESSCGVPSSANDSTPPSHLPAHDTTDNATNATEADISQISENKTMPLITDPKHRLELSACGTVH